MLVTLVLAMAVNACAWDRLYTNDSVMTHDAGTFGVTGGIIYLSANGWYDDGGEKFDFEGDTAMTTMGIPINIYYSVMDQLEVGVQPIFWMNSSTDLYFEGDYDASGLGDTWIDAKYMFLAEPMMSARLGMKLPTGDDEGDEDNGPTGSGTTDFDVALMFGMPTGPGMFGAQAGYRLFGSYEVEQMRAAVDAKCGSEIHFAVCYKYPMSDMMDLKVAVDGFFGSEGEFDGETVEGTAANMVSLNPGVVYLMDNGMDVGLDIHYVLMGQNVASEWGIGLWLGWSSM